MEQYPTLPLLPFSNHSNWVAADHARKDEAIILPTVHSLSDGAFFSLEKVSSVFVVYVSVLLSETQEAKQRIRQASPKGD